MKMICQVHNSHVCSYVPVRQMGLFSESGTKEKVDLILEEMKQVGVLGFCIEGSDG